MVLINLSFVLSCFVVWVLRVLIVGAFGHFRVVSKAQLDRPARLFCFRPVGEFVYKLVPDWPTITDAPAASVR